MKKIPTIFLQIVIVILGISALVLLLWEPHTEGVNAHAKFFEVYLDPFIALVYLGTIPFFVALYQAFNVLKYIRQNKIFSPAGVGALRTIRQCAMTILGFVVLEEVFIVLSHGNDDPAGGIFMGILITAGSTVAAAVATVFEQIVREGMRMK